MFYELRNRGTRPPRFGSLFEHDLFPKSGAHFSGSCSMLLWLYGLPERRKTGYLCAAAPAAEPLRAHRFSRRIRPRSFEPMDSFELNKILGAILGTCLGV